MLLKKKNFLLGGKKKKKPLHQTRVSWMIYVVCICELRYVAEGRRVRHAACDVAWAAIWKDLKDARIRLRPTRVVAIVR